MLVGQGQIKSPIGLASRSVIWLKLMDFREAFGFHGKRMTSNILSSNLIWNLSLWRFMKEVWNHGFLQLVMLVLLKVSRRILSRIGKFSRQNDHSWILTGDLNEVRSLEEHDHGGDKTIWCCTKFNNLQRIMVFLILDYSGPRFTCSRGNS